MIEGVRRAATDAVRPAVRFALRHWMRHEEMIRLRQQIRYLALAELLGRDTPGGDLTPFELSVFSQNGEDGVLAEIYRRIGTGSRFFVEVGASPNEANSVLLADVHGWDGVFIEADELEGKALASKYASRLSIRVVQEFVTAENVTSVFDRAGVPTEPDLLSIDIDGNDYWLWRALDRFRPRVVVIEYNASRPRGVKEVQPYAPTVAWDHSTFFGASLDALLDLANSRGYRLVHLELTGINAFFVREEEASSFLPESEVVRRVPNYFLAGFMHDRDRHRRRFRDVTVATPVIAADPYERQ